MSLPYKPLFISGSRTPYDNVLIQPVVIYNILDHFIRRHEKQFRVIGTLVGVINEGVVEVRNSYPMLHAEGNKIAVSLGFYEQMLNLHKKVFPEETVVGWYSTGTQIYESNYLIHNFYYHQMKVPPIHLLVLIGANSDDSSHGSNVPIKDDSTRADTKNDTTALSKSVGIAVYYAMSISLISSEPVQTHFIPHPFTLVTTNADRIVLAKLSKDRFIYSSKELTSESVTDRTSEALESKSVKLSQLESLEDTVKRLLALIETVSDYVNRVLEGKEAPDNEIGRMINETLALLPSSSSSEFDKIFANGLQDVLMILYLANLTRTHLLLAERLREQTGTTASLQP